MDSPIQHRVPSHVRGDCVLYGADWLYIVPKVPDYKKFTSSPNYSPFHCQIGVSVLRIVAEEIFVTFIDRHASVPTRGRIPASANSDEHL